MAHQGVPKFGNWKDDGDHLYTQYFENARKGKSPGRSVSQNDHNGDPEALSKDPPSVKASPLRTGSDPAVRKLKDERRAYQEDDLRRHEATARKPPNHRYSDHTNHDSAVRKTSMEHSPIHPRHQARIVNKGGVSSPPWERRGSSEGNRGAAPTTPGRSQMRSSGRGDETPDRGSAVPKFGEWDEKDPSTGEGFTGIFDKVRAEKQSGSGNAPVITGDTGLLMLQLVQELISIPCP
ncbi:RPM1-interacting protein 4-like isoform X2 [Phragmites australis]|uniref:RPM1-interacting protein 4-like isoform X2 n=1 Tax=Phragmites australis TaxID=29695 RepID=UPI002D7738AE|nr:RPM1-interacting protein 4-like isoform X2 [Phragmites australis]